MVMPPRVSPTQLIVVPIPNAKLSAEARAALTGKARDLAAELAAAGVRTDSDLRDNYRPGWKYNYWELKVRSPDHRLCFCGSVISAELYVPSGRPRLLAFTAM